MESYMDDLQARATRWFKILAAVIALFGSLNLAVEILDDDQDGRPDRVRITPRTPAPVPASVGVDGPDANAAPDTALPLDVQAREVARNAAATPERFDLSGDLRGDDTTPVAQHTGPLATPNFPGCTTRILPTNWSERTVPMSQVDSIAVHYTAGGNRPGLSDMSGLTAYASSPVAGVSWHFLIDADGHCYYSVPLGKKAWTIGGLNSQTVNIEVIGRGNEPRFPASAAGQRKLSQVVRRLGGKLGIPMRLARYDGCRVTRSGVGTHWMGGACSGGHVDVKPYNIAALVGRIARDVQGPPRTRRAVRRCSVLRYHRRKVAAGASWQDRVRVGRTIVSRGTRASRARIALTKGNVNHRRHCS